VDATTLWLIVGVILLLVVGLVGFPRGWPAPGAAHRVNSRHLLRPHHEVGRRPPKDAGDEPSATLELISPPRHLRSSLKRSSSFRRRRLWTGLKLPRVGWYACAVGWPGPIAHSAVACYC
jgi:hypothetical protein